MDRCRTDNRWTVIAVAILFLVGSGRLEALQTPERQALELQRAAYLQESNNLREAARLWQLAVAAWHDEAVEALLAMEALLPVDRAMGWDVALAMAISRHRYVRAAESGHVAILLATYWAARGCPAAGWPVGIFAHYNPTQPDWYGRRDPAPSTGLVRYLDRWDGIDLFSPWPESREMARELSEIAKAYRDHADRIASERECTFDRFLMNDQ